MAGKRAKMVGARGIDHSKPRQANGCYCVEQHSTPRDIVIAFAACKHPKAAQLQIDADGVTTGYAKGTRGLPVCCQCGAHRRASDGKWVYGHLASCAVNAGRRTQPAG
jgi:hypothetical protein